MAGDRRDGHALFAALSHPLRRRILRAMPGDEPISPVELAAKLQESLTHVSYHVRVLANCGAAKLVGTKQVGIFTQHFYRRSAMAGWAIEALTEPEQESRGGSS